MGRPGDRHLDIAGLERCVEAGVPMDLPIEGKPQVLIVIDPKTPALGLRTEDDGSGPVSALEHLVVRTVQLEQVRWVEVRITAPDLFLSGYPVLCGVADRIQLDGMSVADSLAATLRVFGRLLQKVQTLSSDRELGLFGELWLLKGLCAAVGVQTGVSGWLGPDGAEHDFTLETFDVEVKTTQSERRTHWISSLTQLTANSGRPLWLVSHQLTKAAGTSGWTLPEHVEGVRALVGTGPMRDALEARLRRAGWEDWLSASLHTRWRLRAPSQTFAIGDQFPRLTADGLTEAGVLLAQIPEIQYRIDLSSVEPAGGEVPDVLIAALGSEV